jgi:hypothetical protein
MSDTDPAATAAAEVATAVLVDHQRRDIGSCLCGWAELGRSHPRHQVQMLAAAGVLVADVADAAPEVSSIIFDFPTGWASLAASNPEQHHERCSYRTENRALLCDCAAIHAARRAYELGVEGGRIQSRTGDR